VLDLERKFWYEETAVWFAGLVPDRHGNVLFLSKETEQIVSKDTGQVLRSPGMFC